jgi:hypothetical protein
MMAMAGMKRTYTLVLSEEEMRQDSVARREVIDRLEEEDAREGGLSDGGKRFLKTLQEIERAAQLALKER